MLRFIHQLSAFFFYLLGGSFLVAYLLLRNDAVPRASALWLQTADLPFVLAAILYGGLSLYLSLTAGRTSKVLAAVIGIPLAIAFVVLAALNFWGIGPFSF